LATGSRLVFTNAIGSTWTKNRLSSNIARQLASERFADYTAMWTAFHCQ
jgi:hypothetical protein